MTSSPPPSSGNQMMVEVDDPEVRAIRERVRQMEEESARLREMMADAASSTGANPSTEEADGRSIYVGNVDYSVTVDDLTTHFGSCGTIARCTILCDKWTGHPKGFAYLEFADPAAVAKAVAEMNETLLKNRVIKVLPKRTNIHGYHYQQQMLVDPASGTRGVRGPRGAGLFRGRGRGRGRGSFRGVRGGSRGRGRGHPYHQQQGDYAGSDQADESMS